MQCLLLFWRCCWTWNHTTTPNKPPVIQYHRSHQPASATLWTGDDDTIWCCTTKNLFTFFPSLRGSWQKSVLLSLLLSPWLGLSRLMMVSLLYPFLGYTCLRVLCYLIIISINVIWDWNSWKLNYSWKMIPLLLELNWTNHFHFPLSRAFTKFNPIASSSLMMTGRWARGFLLVQ